MIRSVLSLLITRSAVRARPGEPNKSRAYEFRKPFFYACMFRNVTLRLFNGEQELGTIIAEAAAKKIGGYVWLLVFPTCLIS